MMRSKRKRRLLTLGWMFVKKGNMEGAALSAREGFFLMN